MNRLFSLLLVLSTSLVAQTNIAVLEFDGKNVSSEEASALTDRLRIELFKTNRFSVIEREKMDTILKEQGFQMSGCASDACAVEIGQMIGVEQIVAGSVSRVGNVYSIAARIIGVEKGKILKIATFDYEGPIGDLLKFGMRDVALQLAGEKSPPVESGRSTTAETPQPQTPTVVPQYTPPVKPYTKTSVRKIRFGFLLGGNSSNIYGEIEKTDITENPISKSGSAYGIVALIKLTDFLYLRPELLLSQKGWIYKGYVDYWVYDYSTGQDLYYAYPGEITYDLDYITVPILIQLNLPLTEKLTFYFFGGGAGSRLTKASETIKIPNLPTEKNDIKSYIQSSESSLIVGGGVEINHHFLIDFRADIGLTPIFGSTDGPEELDIDNLVINMMLGFCF